MEYNKEFIAHIRDDKSIQTVEAHCRNVSYYASEIGKPLGIQNLAGLAGYLHDWGKFSDAYQLYIRKAAEDPASVHRGQVNHSSAGAIFLTEYIRDNYSEEDGPFGELTGEIISAVVFSHHGINDLLTIDGTNQFDQRLRDNSTIQYSSTRDIFLREEDVNVIARLLPQAIDEVGCFYQHLQQLNSSAVNRKKEDCFYLGLLVRLLESILVDADRRDTSEFMLGIKEQRLTHNQAQILWEQYQKKMTERLHSFSSDTSLNEARNYISTQCLYAADKEDGIYKLSVPTGGGKTLSSFRYALQLAKQTGKRHIYYIAPYLSILEQNASEIKSLFDDEKNILEFHSNVILEGKDEEQLHQYELLSDNWSSAIIMTTMVRFLDVIFGHKMSDVRRFHQLSNSVIIMDEVQNIPLKYTNLFTLACNYLHEFCHSTVVFCTATQPLFDQVDYPVRYANEPDLVTIPDKYKIPFHRTTVSFDNVFNALDSTQLAQYILGNIKKNALVILNTKSSVRKLHDAFRSRNCEYQIVELTTYMCPQHRLDRIAEIKKLLSQGRKIICISTQLIEAGVDISFETVFRSAAGLDSIIQAAGRCNRNGESRDLGTVRIFVDKDEYLGGLRDIKMGQNCCLDLLAVNQHADLLNEDIQNDYYRQYFFERKNEMSGFIPEDGVNLLDALSSNIVGQKAYRSLHGDGFPHTLRQAFDYASSHFEVIEENDSQSLIVPYGKAIELIDELHHCNIKELVPILRSLQRYTVNIRSTDKLFKSLDESGAIDTSLYTLGLLVLNGEYYNNEEGIVSDLQDYIF